MTSCFHRGANKPGRWSVRGCIPTLERGNDHNEEGRCSRRVSMKEIETNDKKQPICRRTVDSIQRKERNTGGPLGAWEARYERGIEDIDLQHHSFFNLINR